VRASTLPPICAEIGSIPLGTWLAQSWTLGAPLSGGLGGLPPQITRRWVLPGADGSTKPVARC